MNRILVERFGGMSASQLQESLAGLDLAFPVRPSNIPGVTKRIDWSGTAEHRGSFVMEDEGECFYCRSSWTGPTNCANCGGNRRRSVQPEV